MEQTVSFPEQRDSGPGDRGAYMSRFGLGTTATGPLAGRSFAVKDLFDIEGQITGCGNPVWAATHDRATMTAPAVAALLEAGAVANGKTVSDELAFSLIGENAHYGTPVNPAAPGRIPGGSSSGSAVAVAARLADFALGTDTGGSVRLPAAHCGLYGMRPTHGRIALDGVMPLAPGFDTVGWFARDSLLLQQVGTILLERSAPVTGNPAAAHNGLPDQVLIVEDAFAGVDASIRAALAPVVDRVTSALGAPRDITISPTGLEEWGEIFSIIQGAEIWRSHGAWISANRPNFGPGVAERFLWASHIDARSEADARQRRAAIVARLDAILAPGVMLCLPSQPALPPRLRTPVAELTAYRKRALSLLCIAGLGGLPQITVPLGEADDCPVGLSLIGSRGSDAALLAAARRIGD